MRPSSPADRSASGRDWVIGLLADWRDGLVSREGLLAAGIGERSITRALEAGRLRPIFAGVYAVGHAAVSERGWMRAALLAGGPRAILSHETAGRMRGLLPNAELHPLHVIVPGDRGREQRGIVAHRCRIEHFEWLEYDGFRITTPARTIVDLAGSLPPRELRVLIERAQDHGLFAPRQVRQCLAVRKCKGAGRLRDLTELLEPDEENARSFLERLALRAIRGGGLLSPKVNYVVEGRKRDLVWAAIRLVVELDSQKWHATRDRRAIDAYRDRQLTVAGWRTARFTYEDIALEPERFLEALRALGVPPA